MILLIDIGNTNTHLGLGNERRVVRAKDFPTAAAQRGVGLTQAQRWLGKQRISGACLCSVAPQATPVVQGWVTRLLGEPALVLTPATLQGLGFDYPKPETVGQDRLAHSVAAHHHFGAPVVTVGFGTATTFDVVDRRGCFIGGVIVPGLALMTSYLHEKTAQLPELRIREPRGVVGRSTEQAMLAGAVYGYRGLVRGILQELGREVAARHLPVVATGSYAPFVAEGVPEIGFVRPRLALEGLRLIWFARRSQS